MPVSYVFTRRRQKDTRPFAPPNAAGSHSLVSAGNETKTLGGRQTGVNAFEEHFLLPGCLRPRPSVSPTGSRAARQESEAQRRSKAGLDTPGFPALIIAEISL